MADPVSLPPLVERHSPNQSSRHGSPVDLIVVHGTAGAYAGACSWLCNPEAKASAHIVLREDGGEATQLVGWDRKAWHSEAYNPTSEGIELAWSSGRWPREQLRVAARVVAFRLHQRGLPARWARGGKGRGFVRHRELGVLGGAHPRCPTIPYPLWIWFVARVKIEARRGHFRPAWGSNV